MMKNFPERHQRCGLTLVSKVETSADGKGSSFAFSDALGNGHGVDIVSANVRI